MNRELKSVSAENNIRIVLVHGDITEENVDAIVNAANTHLQHGGGVAGAIVRKGGFVIQEQSHKVAPVEVGHSAITEAGQLKSKFVIHAVGPRWGEGDEDKKLYNAVASSILLANENRLESMSLPAISTGIFGFPLERAAGIIMRSIFETSGKLENTSLKEIRLCIFDQKTLEVFSNIFDEIK